MKFKRLIEEEKKREWIIKNYQFLDEAKFSRVVTTYFEKGFIVISAERTCEAEMGRECTPEEFEAQEEKNKKNDKEIHWDFTRAKFGFVPTYGGYREKITNPDGSEGLSQKPNLEKSYIVMNSHDNTEDIKKLGMALCEKYDQESFLFKPPQAQDSKAYFIGRNGAVQMEFEGKTVSDLTQQYYTYLRKEDPIKRFSLKEWVHWAPNSPRSATEAYNRYGEVFIKFSY
jgi:hypothetical protein